MRTANRLVLDAGDASQATLTSTPFRLENMDGFSAQFRWTGSPVGTLIAQLSDDEGQDAQGTGVSNWTDVSGSSAAIPTVGTPSTYEYEGFARWVRFVYTKSSGTGTVSIVVNSKGGY